jgi:hypothetical protein
MAQILDVLDVFLCERTVLNNPLRRTYILTVVAKFKKENIVHLGPRNLKK